MGGLRPARREVRRLREQARAHRAAARLAEERATFERLLARAPANLTALRELARDAQQRGDAQRAQALWERAAHSHPERSEPALELARLALRAGDRTRARALAARAESLAPPGRPYGLAARAASLRRHLDAGAGPLAARHVAIGGVSFCGSTLLGSLLGSLPGVANAGETHWLVHRSRDGRAVPFDFERDASEALVPCVACGVDCAVWSRAFRRELAADPVDWYGRLADRLGAPVLVSSDKNHAKLDALEPLGRLDLLVLFKSPADAWNSIRRRGDRNAWTLESFLVFWEREYGRLLHDLPARRVVVLDFGRFRREPERHWRRLGELLDLPTGDALPPVRAEQHAVAGNAGTHARIVSEGDALRIRARDEDLLPPGERERAERWAAQSATWAALRARSARDFDA